MYKFEIQKELFPKMLRSIGDLTYFPPFFLLKFISSLFRVNLPRLGSGFLWGFCRSVFFPWSVCELQNLPARHRFSLNSPSCSKTDSTTSALLLTTCSLKTGTFPVSFSLLSRQQQFIYHCLHRIPKGLIPASLVAPLSAQSEKAGLVLLVSSPCQI